MRSHPPRWRARPLPRWPPSSKYQPAGAPVERRGEVRFGAGQLVAEQLGEEVVVPEPFATAVQRYDEGVGPLELGKQIRGVVLTGNGIAQRSRESRLRTDVRSKKRRRGSRQVLEHLAPEIVDDVPIVPCKLVDEATYILTATHRQTGEAESSSPPFGSCPEASDVDWARSRSPTIARSRSAASSALNWRSMLLISFSSPLARRRASGSGGSLRVASTRCVVAVAAERSEARSPHGCGDSALRGSRRAP